MNTRPPTRDTFGDISISRPDTSLPENIPPGRPTRPLRRPEFSRQDIPPKSRAPFPVSLFLSLLGVGFLVYLACGYFVVPHLIKSFGTQAIARRLGRPVTIGQAEFDPLRLRLTLINGIVGPLLADPGDKVDPILSFSSLSLDLEAISLPRRALICRQLTLAQPFIHLVHGQDNRFNLATLVPPATPSSLPMGRLIAAVSRRYSINNIEVTEGEVLYNDLPANKVHHLEAVAIALPAIENIGYHSGDLQPQFSARINGTPLEMKGQTTISQGPTTARLNLTMADLDLAAYRDYLPSSFGVKTLSGQADLDLELLYDGTQTEKLRLNGDITLRALQQDGSRGQLTLDSGSIRGWFAPLSKQFHADEITLTHPVWHRQPGHIFPWPALAAILIQPDPRQQGTMPITHLQVSNGEIITPAASVEGASSSWDGIDISINTPQTADDPEQSFFSATARSDTGSRLSVQGSANSKPFAAKGLLVANAIDVTALGDLRRMLGAPLPVTAGTIDQAQANFALAVDPAQKPTLLLEPLAIQAKDLHIELGGQTVEVPVWQSEQGSLATNDPVLHLGKVRLQQAKLTCRRSSSTTAWQTPLTPSDTAGQPPPSPPIDLQGLELTNSSLLIENQGPPDIALHLDRFDLQVDQIDRHGSNTVSAAAMVDDKYPVQASGSFSLSPFAASINLQASDVPLSSLQAIFAHYFALPANGSLTANGTIALPSLDYQGTWSIAELSAPPFSCRKITGEGTAITLRPLAVFIDRLTLDTPGLQVTANENGMPILPRLIRQEWQPRPSPAEAAVVIKAIDISDGSLIYDFPGPPGITISHNKIKGELSDFIVAKEHEIPFSFSGKMENSAFFQVEGSVHPFSAPPSMILTSRVQRLPLSSLAPIVEPYWGFTIKDGTVDFENDLTYENTLIHDVARLTVNGLELGKPLAAQAIKAIGSTWETLPLIQAMLQDNEGSVELAIPIDGRTDTGYTYLEGIRAFLNQTLLKATVSPITILGISQKQAPETIEFEAGSTKLISAMKDRLATLAEILVARPTMAVQLTGSTDAADRKALLRANPAAAKEKSLRGPLATLARQRTKTVSDALSSHGVAGNQILRVDPTATEKDSKPGRMVTITPTTAP